MKSIAATSLIAVACAIGCGREGTKDDKRGPTMSNIEVSGPKSAAYELTWSVARTGEDLTLEYAIKANEELYIADRLWDNDAKYHRIPDPHGVYRFVRDGSLRLVFGPAPYPPNVKLGIYYTPLYSRVRAGETRRASVHIKLPVDEYSILARDVNAPTVVEEVSRVIFVLGYKVGGNPAPPSGAKSDADGYVVYGPKFIVDEKRVDRLPVKRRTGYMARFALPGEPGPEPIPPELLR
jgi:hypothetical protein